MLYCNIKFERELIVSTFSRDRCFHHNQLTFGSWDEEEPVIARRFSDIMACCCCCCCCCRRSASCCEKFHELSVVKTNQVTYPFLYVQSFVFSLQVAIFKNYSSNWGCRFFGHLKREYRFNNITTLIYCLRFQSKSLG